MDIYDIEISTVTTQYMEYLTAMQQLDLEVAGDYLGDGGDAAEYQEAGRCSRATRSRKS